MSDTSSSGALDLVGLAKNRFVLRKPVSPTVTEQRLGVTDTSLDRARISAPRDCIQFESYSTNIVFVDSHWGHGCVRPSTNDILQSLHLSACADVDPQNEQIFCFALKNLRHFWHL